MEKIYKITYWAFLVISVWFPIGLFFNMFKYGRSYEALLALLIDACALVTVTIIRLVFRKVDSSWKQVLALVLVLAMVLLCGYYFIGIH